MKRRTNAQQYSDYADAIRAIREGKKVKRAHAKDGSIATHPVVEVDPNLSEREILHQCKMWLQHHHIFHDRHDAGSFQNERGQWGTYGIKNSGDIHGMIGSHGTRFEIEVKRGSGGRLSLGQQKRMRNIRDNNGIYLMVHGVEELEYLMGEYI